MTKNKILVKNTVKTEKNYDRINIIAVLHDHKLNFAAFLIKGDDIIDSFSAQQFKLIKPFLVNTIISVITPLSEGAKKSLPDLKLVFHTSYNLLLTVSLAEIFNNKNDNSFSKNLSSWLGKNSPFRKKGIFFERVSLELDEKSVNVLEKNGVHSNFPYTTSFVSKKRSLLN